jgi:hypothetical protein
MVDVGDDHARLVIAEGSSQIQAMCRYRCNIVEDQQKLVGKCMVLDSGGSAVGLHSILRFPMDVFSRSSQTLDRSNYFLWICRVAVDCIHSLGTTIEGPDFEVMLVELQEEAMELVSVDDRDY